MAVSNIKVYNAVMELQQVVPYALYSMYPQFNIQQFQVLPTQCIYVSYVYWTVHHLDS